MIDENPESIVRKCGRNHDSANIDGRDEDSCQQQRQRIEELTKDDDQNGNRACDDDDDIGCDERPALFGELEPAIDAENEDRGREDQSDNFIDGTHLVTSHC